MVEPLSKRAQLLSQSVLTQAIFSGLLQWVSWSGFKKGVFLDAFRLEEPHPGILAVQQMVSEGPVSLLHCPLFHIQTFPTSLWISYEMFRTGPSKTISGFLLVQLYCVSKVDNVADQLICSTKTTGGFWVFCRRLNFLLQFRLGIWVFSHSIALHSSQMGSEGPVAL